MVERRRRPVTPPRTAPGTPCNEAVGCRGQRTPTGQRTGTQPNTGCPHTAHTPNPSQQPQTLTRPRERRREATSNRDPQATQQERTIATSRTGTAKWKRVRQQALKQAIDNGVHNCTICGVGLDYEYSQRPNSAEVDHILPHSRGGEDTIGNVQVICRWCNQRKGGKRNLAVPTPKTIEPGTSIEW